ncbi:MAG: secretin N-terminal domain-containing protein [Planctomycetota bacterium]|jgi:hypothetical protein
MKNRTLIISILGVLAVSSVSLAQDEAVPEQELQEPVLRQSDSPALPQPEPSSEGLTAQAPPQAPRSRRRNVEPVRPKSPSRSPIVLSAPTPPTMTAIPAPSSEMVTEVITLMYFQAEELERLITDIFSINSNKVHSDPRFNRIIIQATKEQMNDIKDLIAELDVPDYNASTLEDLQNLVYRIYMFEIASVDEDMKPFSMILQVPPEASTMQLLDASSPNQLQISGFCLSDERDRDGKAEILIQGKAASREGIKHIVFDVIPESRIKELKWDDAETFTNEIRTAQFWQLPEQLQKHIKKLLGDDIRTVGYWFGNSLVPGEVQAPIGPWTLNLQFDTESDRMLELGIEVELPREIHNFETRLGRQQNDEILSNTIRAKIGKPIIIGYNRESYGTRKMGAMVILPEADIVQ